jgi:dihydropyrimidinase
MYRRRRSVHHTRWCRYACPSEPGERFSCVARWFILIPNLQLQHPAGTDTGDSFLSGTRSAIAGGTTTIVAFANQRRQDLSLYPLVEEYHRRARAQCYTDYAFHVILTNPTPAILEEELPILVRDEGITSIKVYMTYEARKVNDRQMLDIMMAARKLQMTLMVHAENDDMVNL